MAAQKFFYINEQRSAVLAVKHGFCWPAFFFGSLWAIVKRMWFPVFWAMCVVDLVLWFITGYAEAQGSGGLALALLLLNIAYAWVRGRWGNRWLAGSLLSRGYVQGQAVPKAGT